MPFYDDLDLREANPNVDDGRWITCSPLTFISKRTGQLFTVPAGFVTDLASVPRYPVVYWLCGGRANKPAVLHDWLYSTCCISRAESDLMFLEAMEDVGVPLLYRRLMYAGVRLGGASRYVVANGLTVSDVLEQ